MIHSAVHLIHYLSGLNRIYYSQLLLHSIGTHQLLPILKTAQKAELKWGKSISITFYMTKTIRLRNWFTQGCRDL